MATSVKNPAKNLFKINLLIHQEEQQKIYVRFIQWMLASGRFFVVLVEILVIGAFAFRYKLDTDVLDLQEKIKEQVPYLESLKSDEQKIRQLQFQLANIKQTRNQNPNLAESLQQISKLTPKNIILTNTLFSKAPLTGQTSMTINGHATSSVELSAFLKALKSSSYFTDINLANISFEGKTTFTITGNLTNKGEKSS